MKLFGGGMSSMLCCFSFDTSEESGHSSSPRRATGNKDTPISMSVHGASVPHTIDSPDALHKIFASNSSMRGYNAIQNRPPKRSVANGSLDLTFRFGSESPKKPRGRLEQLTHHVKQKLSETGLSRTIEHRDHGESLPIPLSNTIQEPRVDAATQLLSNSQKSVGLSELLASHAGSEGGYDSDARSIKTPITLSGAGATKGDQRYRRESLATIEASQTEEQHAEAENTTMILVQPATSPKNPLPRSSAHSEASFEIKFTEAIRMGPEESPTDVLRRISNGVIRGHIRIPDTPEASTEHAAFSYQPATGERSPQSAPQCVATTSGTEISISRRNENLDMKQTLNMLAHRVDQAKRESLASSAADSLISELDPTLLKYIEKFTVPALSENLIGFSSPVTAIRTSSKQLAEATYPAKDVPTAITISSHKAGEDVPILAAANASSLQLFNMQIPQRLANASRIGILSSNSGVVGFTNKSSILKPTADGAFQSRAISISRGPTFIAIEPTRRPSDPETKRLFEPSKLERSRSNWKRSLSDGSIKSKSVVPKTQGQVIDDSSSYYGSIARESLDGNVEPTHPLRQGSLKNPNSLAIGGRSASGSIAQEHTICRPCRSVSATEHSTRGTDHTRAVIERRLGVHQADKAQSPSMSKPSRFMKVDTTPTPVMRRSHNSTDANEEMSEIGIDLIGDLHHQNHSSDSTQAVEDRRNEHFSDAPSDSAAVAALQPNGETGTRDAWLTQGRRTGWGYDFKESSPRKHPLNLLRNDEQELRKSPFLNGQDNASEVWCRAFKRLGEPSDFGRLLATPQFDREGRRKLSIRSVSDQGGCESEHLHTPVNHRRSQSADFERSGIDRGDEALKRRRRSVPILTARSVKLPRRKSQTLERLSNIRKKSFAELHRITVSSRQTDVEKSVSSREPLGIWGRFASHTRDQRNGPAGPVDSVHVRDFQEECIGHPYECTSSPAARSAASHELRSRKSWNLLDATRSKMYRRNTRSMTFALSSAERAKLRRKDLLGRVKRLYRTKSSELHAWTMTEGHRSSVSTSMPAEYPELESLPGGSLRGHSESGMDGTLEQEPEALLDTISEVTSKRSKSVQSYTIPWSKKETQEWLKIYQDCIASTSELKSQNSLHVPTTEARRVLSLTSVLRDSTANFEAELKKNTDLAKERLLQQLQSSSEREEGLPMPGSFA